MGSAPGPSLTTVWSWRERGRQEVGRKSFQVQDTDRHTVEEQARDRKQEREGKTSAPDQLSDFISHHPAVCRPLGATVQPQPLILRSSCGFCCSFYWVCSPHAPISSSTISYFEALTAFVSVFSSPHLPTVSFCRVRTVSFFKNNFIEVQLTYNKRDTL